jgi:hypothetical protein
MVALGNNVELSTFQVNGVDVADGDSVNLPGGARSVNVTVVTVDVNATFAIDGDSNLVVGENTLTVTVLAADGVTSASYTVTLVVQSTDTSVSSITVEGIAVAEGEIVTVPADATSVAVEVTTTDENATFSVSGAEDLQLGENTVTVTVTAQDGTTRDYVFIVRVGGLSADTAVTTLQVNGADVTDGSTVELPARTTAVTVLVETRDGAATFKIAGRTGLVAGNNDIVVTVTAPDGQAVKTYTIHALVAPVSSNTALSVFTVNGESVTDGSTIELPAFTRNVSVVTRTADIEAVAVVSGKTNLVDGSNTLTAVVTAADGTVKTYTVTLVVRVLSSDTTLRTLTFNGQSVAGNVFTTAPMATSVDVIAIANDAKSSVVVTGNVSMRVGSNVITVLVTAENGSSTSYNVTVTVPANNDATLKSLTLNGVEVLNSLSAGPLATGTKSATVRVLTNDPLATFSITGATSLVAGNNVITVTVTAADGVAVKKYEIATYVSIPSSDTGLKIFKINNTPVTDGSTLNVPALTQKVTVEASASDSSSTVVVSGKSGLVEGNNTVTVVVTAQDSSSATYTVTVKVLSLSADNSLKTLQVNGSDYTVGQIVDLAHGTRSITVNALANDSAAYVAVSSTALKTGLNTITVKVTAANGEVTSSEISIRVARSNNTVLNSLTVNGQDALTGNAIVLPVRTVTASVKSVTQDSEAVAVVSNAALVPGSNTVKITVTAADGVTVRKIEIPVSVTPLSSNVNLSLLQVGSVNVADGEIVNVANRTASLSVVATSADSDATVAVSGNTSLKTGENTVSVLVIAADGTQKTYTVTVVVAKSPNKDLESLTVNGLDASSGAVTLPARTTAAVVKAVTADAQASVSVTGTKLVAGGNTVVVKVTAADGSSRVVEVLVTVTAISSDNTLKTFRVNGVDYVAGSTLQLGFGSSAVSVVAVSNDSTAKVQVAGATSLIEGLNTVTVTVKADNGDTAVYTAKVNVPVRSSNADMSSVTGIWSINGIDVSDENTVVEVPAGTTAVTATAKTADSKATLSLTGFSGLKTGVNTVTFRITAEDGVTVRTFLRTVNVKAVSANTNLSALTVAGFATLDGGTVHLPVGTSRVKVAAVLESTEAKLTLSGNTGLVGGDNIVKVVVTAPSGAERTYSVTVNVAIPGSDTSLSTFTVNGTTVSDGSVVSIASGARRVKVAAITGDSSSSVVVTGKAVVEGVNTLTVVVTALNGDSRTYTVTLNVGN